MQNILVTRPRWPIYGKKTFKNLLRNHKADNHRHSESVVKYNIGLKTLLQQGISEPIFYGDLVYKF